MAQGGPVAIDEVPWDRVMDFHGRASNVPLAIQALHSSDASTARTAVKQLRRALEHQDGVVHATPITVPYIVAALDAASTARVQLDILELLQVFLASAAFQAEGRDSNALAPVPESLLAEDKLLPPFVSDDDDELLWEVPTIVDDVELWAVATVDQIVSYRTIIEQFARAETAEVAAAARQLIAAIEQVSQERLTDESEDHESLPVKTPWWRFW